MIKKLLLVLLHLSIIGCGETNNETKVDGRWYTQSQVNSGRVVFEKNCAECHGKYAQGTFNWKQTLPDGSYPPPPLNGSAHTWHHPLSVLKRTINNGSLPLGGKMPPFKDKLSEQEKDAVISFFQSHWSQEIYEAWVKRGGLN
jgi:mono/diheme cytochrome c family protein